MRKTKPKTKPRKKRPATDIALKLMVAQVTLLSAAIKNLDGTVTQLYELREKQNVQMNRMVRIMELGLPRKNSVELRKAAQGLVTVLKRPGGLWVYPAQEFHDLQAALEAAT